jgi:hypothetical protein
MNYNFGRFLEKPLWIFFNQTFSEVTEPAIKTAIEPRFFGLKGLRGNTLSALEFVG